MSNRPTQPHRPSSAYKEQQLPSAKPLIADTKANKAKPEGVVFARTKRTQSRGGK
jgi:hypothetical protein